jgi:hypothetical protein
MYSKYLEALNKITKRILRALPCGGRSRAGEDANPTFRQPVFQATGVSKLSSAECIAGMHRGTVMHHASSPIQALQDALANEFNVAGNL